MQNDAISMDMIMSAAIEEEAVVTGYDDNKAQQYTDENGELGREDLSTYSKWPGQSIKE